MGRGLPSIHILSSMRCRAELSILSIEPVSAGEHWIRVEAVVALVVVIADEGWLMAASPRPVLPTGKHTSSIHTDLPLDITEVVTLNLIC